MTIPPPPPLDGARDEAIRAVQKARAKVARRAAAIEADLARISESRAVAARATWLVPQAAKAARGATELRGWDWSTGEAVEVVVPLDPALDARANLEALFRKARRLEGGLATAEARLERAWREQDELATLLDALAVADGEPAIEALVARAKSCAPGAMPRVPSAGSKGKGDPQALPPHRTFLGHADVPIWVGRGAAKNDALTFEIARPFHLWLHARGVPGAHVVVPVKRGHACPAELLIDAAHLAAHFSDARDEAIVEVTTAPRKWVRKPRGAAPGAVTIEREKVVVVRVEPSRTATLLAREVLA